jgi:hypothetical protein
MTMSLAILVASIGLIGLVHYLCRRIKSFKPFYYDFAKIGGSAARGLASSDDGDEFALTFPFRAY